MQRLMIMVATLMVVTPYIFASKPFETIHTKDGSVYMGHTGQQIFEGRNSKTIFYSDSAILVIPKEKVARIFSDKRNPEFINSESWKNWFAENPQYVNLDAYGDKSAVLYQISLVGRNNFMTAYMLEKSPDMYKLFVLDATRDTIPDNDITLITYAPRDLSDTNGIVDEITTVDGDVFTGQIVSWDNKYTGVLNGEGTIDLVPNNLIAQKKIYGLNPNVPLLQQVKYLDEVESDSPTRGIITERNRRPPLGFAPYYTIFNDSSHEDVHVEMGKVKTIKRKKNYQYVPIADVTVETEVDTDTD